MIWMNNLMTNKKGSILDYQQKELCPVIWNKSERLRPSVKSFIFSSLSGFFETLNLKGYDDFIIDMFIGSSLATYFYTAESDLDIKIVVDITMFKSHNRQYSKVSEDDILDGLIELSGESSWLTAYIPQTHHQLDVYFLSAREASPVNMIKYDSIYNLMTDRWLKQPEKIEGELSPSYVLNHARSKARQFLEKLSIDMAEAQRDSMDFLILKDHMKELGADDLQQFKEDLEISLERLNASVEMLVEDRELIKDIRKKTFKKGELRSYLEKMMGSLNYSDSNLIFKLLQRYGYMQILSEINKIYKDKKVTPKEVEEVAKILA